MKLIIIMYISLSGSLLIEKSEGEKPLRIPRLGECIGFIWLRAGTSGRFM
jgi:hypothetical protein